MADSATERDFAVCTLVERTGNPTGEIIYDAIRVPIKAEMHVPARLARWLFGNGRTQHRVHTTDGQYVCQLGIKHGPDELLSLLGSEAFDCSPIEVATDMAEGWDTAAIDPDRATTMRAHQIKVPPSEFRDRQGSRGGFTKVGG